MIFSYDLHKKLSFQKKRNQKCCYYMKIPDIYMCILDIIAVTIMTMLAPVIVNNDGKIAELALHKSVVHILHVLLELTSDPVHRDAGPQSLTICPPPKILIQFEYTISQVKKFH